MSIVAVVVLATQDDSGQGAVTVVKTGSAPALRTDGGPEESTTGGALGAQQPSARPDGSVVAKAVAGP